MQGKAKGTSDGMLHVIYLAADVCQHPGVGICPTLNANLDVCTKLHADRKPSSMCCTSQLLTKSIAPNRNGLQVQPGNSKVRIEGVPAMVLLKSRFIHALLLHFSGDGGVRVLAGGLWCGTKCLSFTSLTSIVPSLAS